PRMLVVGTKSFDFLSGGVGTRLEESVQSFCFLPRKVNKFNSHTYTWITCANHALRQQLRGSKPQHYLHAKSNRRRKQRFNVTAPDPNIDGCGLHWCTISFITELNSNRRFITLGPASIRQSYRSI